MPIALLVALLAVPLLQSKPAAPAPWPKLDAAKAKEFGLDLDSLLKTPTPAGADEMAARLAGYGKGAVLPLYEALARRKVDPDADQPEEVRRLLLPLEKVITAEDGPRLIADCSHKSPWIRRLALKKVGQYLTPGALPAAKKALSDPDEETRFEATLTCFSLGSIDGIPVLLEASRNRWPKVGKRIRDAVERHRSDEATDKIMPGLRAAEWQDVCAALRLLAGIGTPKCARDVGVHLDSTDHRIKEDAINALRGIVDKAPPLEKLSAFDLAEQATNWKKRL